MRSRPLARKSPKNTKKTAWNSTLRPEGETKKKRRGRYSAYLKTATWKAKRRACLKRAGYRCECSVKVVVIEDGRFVDFWTRCEEAATRAHHRTYARFGGAELPEDLLACCQRHHDELEAKLRPWNRSRRFGC